MSKRLTEFMGRGVTRSLTADFVLKRGQERVQAFTPDIDNHTVTLPTTELLRLGGPHFFIINLSNK